jgi:hypothetical protein
MLAVMPVGTKTKVAERLGMRQFSGILISSYPIYVKTTVLSPLRNIYLSKMLYKNLMLCRPCVVSWLLAML